MANDSYYCDGFDVYRLELDFWSSVDAWPVMNGRCYDGYAVDLKAESASKGTTDGLGIGEAVVGDSNSKLLDALAGVAEILCLQSMADRNTKGKVKAKRV